MKIVEIKLRDFVISVRYIQDSSGIPVFGSMKSKELPRPEFPQAIKKVQNLLNKPGKLGFCTAVWLESISIKYLKNTELKDAYTFSGILQRGKDDMYINWKLQDVMANSDKELDAAITDVCLEAGMYVNEKRAQISLFDAYKQDAKKEEQGKMLIDQAFGEGSKT